ncbi:MAG: DUF58 domain-containing protein [Armatimonadetes bacterium]|nr:DUF58 domain-containing protein [Armatimonadota bacterium]MDE2205300.1 DUF58 domain-containing protein [Armatimonadota bacterium]
MIFSRRYFVLALAIVLASLAVWVWPSQAILGTCGLIALTIAACLDARTAPRLNAHDVRREAPRAVKAQEPATVRITVTNGTGSLWRLRVLDTPDSRLTFDLPTDGLRFVAFQHAETAVDYTFRAPSRGRYRFANVAVYASGRLGLASRRTDLPLAGEVDVYPELPPALVSRPNARRIRLGSDGTRSTRRHGQGRQFESLRDFQPDDELRRVDWRATARRGKLISREYEAERSQAVIIALDLGRVMSMRIGGKPRLETAITAALALARTALEADDRVGLLTFGAEVGTFLQPERGSRQLRRIQQHLMAAEPSLEETSFAAALGSLARRARRRTLIVCFTDLWDRETSVEAIDEVAIMARRHLMVVAAISDPALTAAAAKPPEDELDVYRSAAAATLLTDRRRALAALAGAGAIVLDSTTAQINASVISRYIQAKERMAL